MTIVGQNITAAVETSRQDRPFALRAVTRAAFIGFGDGIGDWPVADLGCPDVHGTAYSTVQDFAAQARIESVDVVFVDADVFDPETLTRIMALKERLTGHDSVKIIATVTFSPGAFNHRLEQAGCTQIIKRTRSAVLQSLGVSEVQTTL